jgi:hypothetical protein
MKLVLSLALVGLMATACMGLTCTKTKAWTLDGTAASNAFTPFVIDGFDLCTDGNNPAFTLSSVTVSETPHQSTYSVTFQNTGGTTIADLQITGGDRVRIFTENTFDAASLASRGATTDEFYESGSGTVTDLVPSPNPVANAPDIGPGATFTITLANFDSGNVVSFYGPNTQVTFDEAAFNPPPVISSKTFTTAYTNFFAIFDDTDWTFYVRKFYNLAGNVAANLVTVTANFPSSGVVTADYNYAAVITGDPQFAGFQGQQFQVHGIPEEFF